MILLHTLPPGHPLRLRPLLGAKIRNLQSKAWRTIEPSWGIAQKCYDDLSGPWLEYNEFQAGP